MQRFTGNKIVDSDVVNSNVNLRVDSEEVCTGIISMHSDKSSETEIGKAFEEPSDVAGTVGHRNKFSFGS